MVIKSGRCCKWNVVVTAWLLTPRGSELTMELLDKISK